MLKIAQKIRRAISEFLNSRKDDRLPDLSELPDSFYVGQEYVEDQNKIPILIEVFFYSVAVLDKAVINALGKQVILEQRGALLRFAFEEKISEKLFENIKHKHRGDDWILGYVIEVMPFVNQEILRQRYENAHLLTKTFSTLDIYRLLISKNGEGKRIEIHWPKAITAFPPVTELAKKYDLIHLRDLIDAIHSFFNNNFDDCVRRLITSIENAFDFYKLKRIKKERNSKFEDIIKQNVDIKCMAINKNIADEIIEAYRIRNKIVHEGYRIPPTQRTLCRHLIHMVLDFYKFYGRDEDLKKFSFFIEMQWQSNEQFVGSGLTLQKLEVLESLEGNKTHVS